MFYRSVLECQEREGGFWIERSTNSLWKMLPAGLTSRGRLAGMNLAEKLLLLSHSLFKRNSL